MYTQKVPVLGRYGIILDYTDKMFIKIQKLIGSCYQQELSTEDLIGQQSFAGSYGGNKVPIMHTDSLYTIPFMRRENINTQLIL